MKSQADNPPVHPLQKNLITKVPKPEEPSASDSEPRPDPLAPCDDKPLEKPQSKAFLLVILFINFFITFGQCYVYDFPQALEGALITRLKANTMKVSFLYAVYSLPNMIFSPITGYVIEVAGCANSAVIYTSLTYLGQAVIYYGVANGSYLYVFLGRGLYGIGGEGLTILQLTINELWFYGNFLSISVAWCDIVAVLAIMLGNYFNPLIFVHTRSLSLSFFVSALVCFFSAIVGLLYYIYHKKFIHRLDDMEDLDESRDASMEITIIPPESKNKSKVVLDESSVERDRRATAEDIYNAEKIRFGFKSIRYFNTTYWILCVVFLFLANCYYQYTNIATEILEHRFGYTFEEANKLTIIPEAAFIVVSPFVSKWVEVKGKKPLWLLVAAVIFLGNYSYMYFMKVEKTLVLYLNFTAIGFGYSITTCALFSSVALSIPKAGVSMGYSILTLIENIGLSLLPLYFGEISEDRSVESYNQCLLTLIILSILATIFCLLLLLYDTKNSNLLTLPENSKKVRKLRKGIDSDFLEKSVRGNTSVSFKQPDESNGTESFFVAGLPKKRDKRALSTVA